MLVSGTNSSPILWLNKQKFLSCKHKRKCKVAISGQLSLQGSSPLRYAQGPGSFHLVAPHSSRSLDPSPLSQRVGQRGHKGNHRRFSCAGSGRAGVFITSPFLYCPEHGHMAHLTEKDAGKVIYHALRRMRTRIC